MNDHIIKNKIHTAQADKYLLSLEDLSFYYEYQRKQFEVLHDINLKLSPGECIGLIGANGVGKSTLLKLLVGLLDHQTGAIEVDGIPVTKKNLSAIRQKIGYVFQESDHQLFMNTVYDDVAFAPRNYGYGEEEVRKCTKEALAAVNILPLKNRQTYRLSGGEKKLASIATVLAMGVDLILFDEPSVALDPRNRRNLIQVLNRLPQAKIIASHDLDFILDTCERTILLHEGRIIADGATETILRDQELLEAHGLELPFILQKRR